MFVCHPYNVDIQRKEKRPIMKGEKNVLARKKEAYIAVDVFHGSIPSQFHALRQRMLSKITLHRWLELIINGQQVIYLLPLD
jgi:hypothetical protein